METINNNQMSEFTTHHKHFRNNTGSVYTATKKSTSASVHPDLYIVYSYGKHFPMYVYDNSTGHWFGNSSKYSPTTSKHQTLTRPNTPTDRPIAWISKDELVDLVALGGYAPYCAERCTHIHIH